MEIHNQTAARQIPHPTVSAWHSQRLYSIFLTLNTCSTKFLHPAPDQIRGETYLDIFKYIHIQVVEYEYDILQI